MAMSDEKPGRNNGEAGGAWIGENSSDDGRVSERHKIGSPNFGELGKSRRGFYIFLTLLGTQLGCTWAMLAILQAQPMEAEERIQKAAAALLEASNRSIGERRTAAATWWPVGTLSISFLPTYLPSSSTF
uniref:Uncharacterized protein n=1 Tax=Oryza sativa subsp. japonica TaxID=39947 RepID=Q2QWG9_ORYSJ|nr:hypothetical protein LOC_Os12g09380 [Oryza sativa Japonica Group]